MGRNKFIRSKFFIPGDNGREEGWAIIDFLEGGVREVSSDFGNLEGRGNLSGYFGCGSD